ncbi:MAG: RHS repeat-associated core domain-containing protein, partial [Kiritimatiellae bacterium]|nr:RHS repeat-associated core domain-containing protein [Kiritimatiellia bacterium]
GNIVGVTSSNQSVLATLTYTPFGEVLARTGSFTPRYQFSTKEYSPRIGLNYYGHRFYSPRIGRWPNRDPEEEFGSVNLCSFSSNSPINFVDSLGLEVRLSPWNGEAVNDSSATTITIQGDWVEHEWHFGALKAIAYPWTTGQDKKIQPPSNAPWRYIVRREMSGTYDLPPGHSMKNDHSLLTKIVDSDFLVGATKTVYEDKKCCKKATFPVKIGWNTLKVHDCPNGIDGVYYTK